MKKNLITSTLFAGLLLVGATSCESFFEDDVVSPNDPETTTPSLLLPNIQVATFATFNGQLARQGEVFIQRLAGTSAGSQTVEIANYVITDQTNQNEWDGIYTGVMANGRIMISDYGADNPYYAGITRVLMAMNMGLTTSLWGDIPFSEAGTGLSGNLEPNYEAQQQVYAGIQALLDDAIANLAEPANANTFTPGSDDLVFGGDVAMWTKTAYTLKARFANHLGAADPAGSAADALNFLTNGIAATAENCNMAFDGTGNALNQWFAYENSRGGYIRVNATYLDTLLAIGDPRAPFFFGLDAYGGYSGTPYDQVDSTNSSYIGALYATPAAPLPLVTYVEAKFIEAEAQMRANNTGDAATALNDAVKESILSVTGAPDAAYEATYASETGATISMEKIMFQKWIAMFLQTEGYSDWRRTGFPALNANPNASLSQIPLRLPTPQQERLYNGNATVVSDVLQPVWWDM